MLKIQHIEIFETLKKISEPWDRGYASENLRHADADYGWRSVPQWRSLLVAKRKAQRALSRSQRPSQDQRSHAPWLARACKRAIIAWLRLYLCGSGACAGAFLIRFQLWLFLLRRLMVVVLTRWLVSCAIASTTFLTSFGESSRYSYTFCCSSAVKKAGRPLRGRS